MFDIKNMNECVVKNVENKGFSFFALFGDGRPKKISIEATDVLFGSELKFASIADLVRFSKQLEEFISFCKEAECRTGKK